MIFVNRLKTKLITVSSLVMIAYLVTVSALAPSRAQAVADTGGYPWADATLIRAATYDWGYTSCQPAMRHAKTCTAHTSTKLGITYYQSDPWRYDVRNCTSYVAWKINQIFGVSIPSWGNANNWDTAAKKAGYIVDKLPAVGSVAVWEGFYGHVAYVHAVNPDGSVNVEQYNKGGTGVFSRQSRVRANNYIHIGTLPPPFVPATAPMMQDVTTPIPTDPTPLPQNATPLGTPESPVVPLQPLKTDAKGGLPASLGIQYLPALDPVADQVNIYAVEWQHTNSGNVEISKSNGADGNTSWQQRWVTNVPTNKEASSSYLVADANADGRLDLYVIQQQKIVILDGSSDYKQSTGQPTPNAVLSVESADYSLADYDGNGSLDLYAIRKTPEKVDIQILDGTELFAKPLAQWQTPARPKQNSTYVVADHDRDGRADVYEMSSEVVVYAAVTNYQETLKSWKTEEITF